jgi:hypothetical protein
MKPEQLAEHLRRRRAIGEKICAEATEFKVCAMCFSISYKQDALCQFCRGYRWFYSTDAVRMLARYMQQFPIPFTAPVAPRLQASVNYQQNGSQKQFHQDN